MTDWGEYASFTEKKIVLLHKALNTNKNQM